MQAGRLNERITIQNFITIRLPSGQPDKEWSDGRTIWAEVRGVSGRELIASGAEMGEATIRVWTRITDDITSASRIRCESGGFKGSTLDVVAPPIPDAKNDRMEILCKLGVKS